MGALPKNKWLAASALAIILPLSLLTTFKFTGLIGEPQTPKTINQQPVIWNMTRPSSNIMNIGARVENVYVNEGIAIGIYVNVAWYVENPDSTIGPYFGRDGICFVVDVNLSAQYGSYVSLAIRFRPIDANAIAYVDNDFIVKRDALVTDIEGIGVDTREAYIKAKILNFSSYLSAQVHWVFDDLNDENHAFNVILETVYYDGMTYQRIVLPVTLQTLISTTTVEE
jgi:hypothetical protein